MIWDVQKANDPAALFREAARNELLSLAPDLRDQEGWVDHWADVFSGVCRAGYAGGEVPADHFGVLLARSLWMMNRGAAAEAALRKWCSQEVALLCRPASAGAAQDGQRLALCRTGLLRGGNWAFMNGRGWIIDLARLTPESGGILELMLCRLLRRLILEIAPVWDASAGEGWLGLKGMDGLSEGRGAGRGAAWKRGGEVVFHYAESVLQYAARQRGWTKRPCLKKLAI